jgi:RNA polymerase sigma-70 factor (ECF subfamily)
VTSGRERRFLNGAGALGERPLRLSEFRERDADAHGESAGATPDLREVFRLHVDYVWRMARALGLSSEDADDVTQEVFLVAHRRLGTYRPGASIRAWLFGITRNLVMHHRRGFSSRARHLSAMASRDVAVETPERSLRVQQAAALMQSFLDQLDVDKRVVFVLGDVEGMTTPEIAEMLGVPAGTVSSRLRAARSKLERFTARMAARANARGHG